jgi:hypothetical protein
MGRRTEEETEVMVKVSTEEGHIFKLRRHQIHALFHSSRERPDRALNRAHNLIKPPFPVAAYAHPGLAPQGACARSSRTSRTRVPLLYPLGGSRWGFWRRLVGFLTVLSAAMVARHAAAPQRRADKGAEAVGERRCPSYCRWRRVCVNATGGVIERTQGSTSMGVIT